MVEHQGDVTEVEYPERHNDLPRDAGETFDLVVRKGPISLNGIMDQQAVYSENDTFTHLQALEDADYIDSVEGDLEEHGTTRTVYYVPKEGDSS